MKLLPTRPKGVLFDLGGTLLSELAYDIAAGRRRILELARNPERVTLTEYSLFADELHAATDPQRDISLVEFPSAWFCRLVCGRLGVQFDVPDDEIELAFWQAATGFKPAPGIHAALDALKAHGLPTGILSNSSFSGKILSWELARHGLLDYFRLQTAASNAPPTAYRLSDFAVMSSADYGLRKPHPFLFKMAAGTFGLNPCDIVFVGDSLRCDVAGARAAGMMAVWYNPHGLSADPPLDDPRQDVAPQPLLELRHWSGFPRLLER